MVVKVKTDDLPLAVEYYRMSKDEQFASIPEQQLRVRPYFAGKYRIVETYIDEGKSGSKDTDKREAFLRMIHDLTTGKHKGKVKVVVCLDKSRFGRLDTIKGAKHKGELAAVGVCLDTVNDGFTDWRKSMDRIVDCVQSEGNHDLSLKIASKGLGGRIRVTREGKPNQVTPYGLAKLVTSPTGDKITVKRQQPFRLPKGWDSEFVAGEPAEVEAVLCLFKTFDTHDISYNELAVRLTEAGYPSPTGLGWRGDTITWMLKNSTYAGDLRIGQTGRGEFFRVSGDKEAAVAEVEGPSVPIITRDAHKGIIPRALFDRVQAKIARDFKSRRPPRRNGPYALSGIIFCGQCGKPMYGSKNFDGRNIYRCHRQEENASNDCGFWIGYEEQILPVILKDFFQAVREEIVRETSRIETVQLPQTTELEKLQQALAVLERKLEQGREAVLDAPKEVRAGLLATLEKREAEKRELLGKIKAATTGTPESGLLAWWERYQQEFFDSCPIDVGFLYPPGEHPLEKLAEGSEAACNVNYGCDDPRHGNGSVLRDFDKGLHVVPIPSTGEALVVKTKIPAAVLREKLRRIGTQVSVWFRRKAKGRGYDLDRVRVQAYINGAVCYEYSTKDASSQHTCISVDRWYDQDDLRRRA